MNSLEQYIHGFLNDGKEEDCLRELVQEHYSKVYLTTSIAFFGTVLVAYINWLVATQDQKTQLIIWMAFVVILTIIRLSLVVKYNRHMAYLDNQDKALNPYPWAKWEVVCCATFGAIVGGLFFIMYQGSLLDHFANAQVSVMMVAMAIAISSFLAVYLPCYIAFAATSVLPVFVKVLMDIDLAGVVGLAMFSVFHIYVYRFLRALNRKLSEPIELRLQNIELIENLARRNDAIRNYSEDLLLVISNTSSSLMNNYLKLASAQHNFYCADKGVVPDEFAQHLVELENLSMLNASIVDIENKDKTIAPSHVALTDALDRLPLKILELAQKKSVTFSANEGSLLADPQIFDVILRCLSTNFISDSQAQDFNVFMDTIDCRKFKFVARNIDISYGCLIENVPLIQHLSRSLGLSVVVIFEPSSEVGFSFSLDRN